MAPHPNRECFYATILGARSNTLTNLHQFIRLLRDTTPMLVSISPKSICISLPKAMNRPKKLLFLIVALCGLAPAILAENPIIYWNNKILNTTRLSRNPAPIAGVHLATFSVALFDVANSFDPRYRSWLVQEEAPEGASRDAALASAARAILMSIWGKEVNPQNINAYYEEAVSAIPDGPSKQAGISWGEQVAARVLEERSKSGMGLPLEKSYSSDAVGEWRETPLGFRPPVAPRLGEVTPFALQSSSQFRAPEHPPIHSRQYAEEIAHVNRVGIRDGADRTEYQTLSTPFWSDDLGTATPPGHWNVIFQPILSDLGRDEDVLETAHAFALLNLAGADAGITAWETKFHYNIWRPENAIRELDTDTNQYFTSNPDFIPNMESPAFPSYTSGHSCYTASMTRMIEHLIGRNEIVFTATSDGLPGVIRTYESLSDARWEVGMSRVWGGIHTMSDNIEGQRAGIAVADWIFENSLLPLE